MKFAKMNVTGQLDSQGGEKFASRIGVSYIIAAIGGGVVTPAQALLVIVPDDAGLEVEAQILNRDIGFVRAGQDAEIKLDAFPYTHYGTIAGKVTSISHDAVKDDKLGLIYPARVRLSKHVIVADGKSIQLEPGMASSVEIKTEQRRIIEYLLTPLLKYRNEALKER